MRRAALLLILGLGAQHVDAQDNSYGYVGAFGGYFDYEEDLAPGQSFSDSTTAVRVYGGYRFGEWFTVEGSYGVTDNLEEPGTQFLGFPATLGLDFDLLTVNALGHVAFDKLSLFGGVGYWDANATASVTVDVPGSGQFTFEDSESDSGSMISVGVQWEFDALAIRAEYDWFDMADTVDASMFGVGVHWLFGR